MDLNLNDTLKKLADTIVALQAEAAMYDAKAASIRETLSGLRDQLANVNRKRKGKAAGQFAGRRRKAAGEAVPELPSPGVPVEVPTVGV